MSYKTTKMGRFFTGGVLLIQMAALLAAADFPLVQPKDVAAALKGTKPLVIQVGPNVLYRSKHIPGAIYAGPAAKPDGLALLQAAVEKEPRNREIVLYCGCCPWDHCPNVKPAIEMMKKMGFTNVKVMYVAENFKTNWIDQGYPVEAGTQR